jgi:Na+/H+ antiporter NhaA
MFLNAFLLGSLSVIGGWFIYKRLPNYIKQYLLTRPLFTDLTLFIVVYIVFSGTLTALLAAAIAGIIVSVLLNLSKRKPFMDFIDKLTTQAEIYWTKLEEWLGSIIKDTKEEINDTL